MMTYTEPEDIAVRLVLEMLEPPGLMTSVWAWVTAIKDDCSFSAAEAVERFLKPPKPGGLPKS